MQNFGMFGLEPSAFTGCHDGDGETRISPRLRIAFAEAGHSTHYNATSASGERCKVRFREPHEFCVPVSSWASSSTLHTSTGRFFRGELLECASAEHRARPLVMSSCAQRAR